MPASLALSIVLLAQTLATAVGDQDQDQDDLTCALQLPKSSNVVARAPSVATATDRLQTSTGAAATGTPQTSTGNLRECVNIYAAGLDKVHPGLGDAIRSHPLVPTAVSNRNLVIGAGFGTTGTTSLAEALEHCGLNTLHTHSRLMTRIYPALSGPTMVCDDAVVTRDYVQRCLHVVRTTNYTDYFTNDTIDAAVDTPMGETLIDMLLAFPNAKVILTKRPGADWLHQRRYQFCKEHWPMWEPCGTNLRSKRYFLTHEDATQLMKLHEEVVRCAVRRERLLEFSLFTDPQARLDGLMQELCEFVEHPIPNQMDFPHSYSVNLEGEWLNCTEPRLDAGCELMRHGP